MSFGPRKAITDRYDQKVQVDVDEGDADVEINWRAFDDGRYCNSPLSPDDADRLADQLRAAAAYIRDRGLEPHA